MSQSMYRRRRWRTFATTLALTLGSLALPAAALADGQLDPTYNGTGYHVGTVAEGTVFNNTDTRIPMIVQANGSVVIGGSRAGVMTLVRYTPTGALDTTFGVGGFATAQFSGTPTSGPGNSGATAMTTDGTGNIIVAGFGASQSEFAARFTANGIFSGAAVCYAPHLIDYTARAVALRGTAVVLVGYARDRHPSIAVPGTPAVIYGQRAVVTIPAAAVPPVVSTTACGTYSDNGGLSLGSSGVQIDGLGHDGTPAPDLISQAGRQYDGVAVNADGSYVVASTIGPDGASWVQKFTGAGVGALDATFNPLGATPGRLPVAGVNFHAIKLGNGADTSFYIAGESVDAAVAGNRQMLIARVSAVGALGNFGDGRHRTRQGRGRQRLWSGTDVPGHQPDRRRLRQPRRQGGLRHGALLGRRPRHHVRRQRPGRHAVRHARRERVHHRHGSERQLRLRLRPPERSGRPGHGLGQVLRDRRPAAAAAAPGRLDRGRRPGHRQLGSHHRHRQHERHREHLVDRVRHHDGLRRARRPRRRSAPRPTTSTCRPRSPVSQPAPPTTHAS